MYDFATSTFVSNFLEMLMNTDEALFELVKKVDALADYQGLEFYTKPAESEELLVREKRKGGGE